MVPAVLGHLPIPVTGPYLPMLGGEVVTLTQLYWPIVHPALQERNPLYKLLRPVFAGKTESDTEIASIVFYTDNANELDAYLKVADNPIVPLSAEFKMELGFDLDRSECLLYLESIEWTGTARGSTEDLLREPYTKWDPDHHVRRE